MTRRVPEAMLSAAAPMSFNQLPSRDHCYLALALATVIGSSAAACSRAAVASPIANPSVLPAAAAASNTSAAAPTPPGNSTASKSNCTGSLSANALQQLKQRATETRECYELLLEFGGKTGQGMRKGRLAVSMRVSRTGHFESKKVEQDEIGEPLFADCVLSHFEAPIGTVDGDCVEVTIPLQFEPKPDESPAPAAVE